MPGSVKALRLVRLLAGGALTAEQLEAELADAVMSGAFAAAVRQRTVADVLFASTPAMAAVIGSTRALGVVAASAVAMAAIAGNYAAISAVMGSAIGRADVWGSDAALAALANATTVGYLRALGQYTTLGIGNANSTTAQPMGLTGRAILIDMSTTAPGLTLTFAGRRIGSLCGTLGPVDPAAGALPGDVNVMALEANATVAASPFGSTTTNVGLIYV